MFLNRELLRQMRWTAHGVKTLPSDIVVDMRWQEDLKGNVKTGDAVPAGAAVGGDSRAA